MFVSPESSPGRNFYPRPPRGGRRPNATHGKLTFKFLSTPSARRATSAKRNINGSTINFYPRPPRGGRLKPTQLMSLQNQISIHALREEGDRLAAWQTCFQQDFYPRPPRGGRRVFLDEDQSDILISIHALREEGDGRARIVPLWAGEFLSTPSARRATRAVEGSFAVSIYFYPRPPRGGRRGITGTSTALSEFLSTPSARRATIPPIRQQRQPERFLSTPSARRATAAAARATARPANFYPRPPRGGRQPGCRPRCRFSKISIHALREEGDESQHHTVAFPLDFYPRPPRGGRPSTASTFTLTAYFYPRPPRGGRQLPQWVTTMIMNFYPRPPRGGRLVLLAVRIQIVQFLSTPSARRATTALVWRRQ